MTERSNFPAPVELVPEADFAHVAYHKPVSEKAFKTDVGSAWPGA
jgi:hypothetical protein